MLLNKILRNLLGLMSFTIVTLNTIVCFVPLAVLAVIKLVVPIAPLRQLMTRWIMTIGRIWVSFNALVFGLVNDTHWDVRGLSGLSSERWYLVVSNHQTWTDIVALQTTMNGRIPFLKFFIKQQLVWFPVLGIAWWAMDMPFMKRYSKSYLAEHPEKKGQDLEATRRACEKFRTTPTSVINFIEGTRFTTDKHRKRASKFRHLLPPRAGGIALAISSMGEMFDAILDITIVYPTGPTRFWDVFCGKFDRIVIDIVSRPVEDWMLAGDYNDDREFRSKFHRWLTSVWEDKDRRMQSLLEETATEIA